LIKKMVIIYKDAFGTGLEGQLGYIANDYLKAPQKFK